MGKGHISWPRGGGRLLQEEGIQGWRGKGAPTGSQELTAHPSRFSDLTLLRIW